EARRPSLAVISAWAAVLAAVCGAAGRAGLGTLLTAAFVVQVGPSLWTAYRTTRLSGISAGTWTLILGELLCFLIYGWHESDPRLVALGATGVTASALMLARIFWTRWRAGTPSSTAGCQMSGACAPAQGPNSSFRRVFRPSKAVTGMPSKPGMLIPATAKTVRERRPASRRHVRC